LIKRFREASAGLQRILQRCTGKVFVARSGTSARGSCFGLC